MKINTLMRMIPRGKIFSVTFTKIDGTTRKMCCRTNVSKGVKGVGLNYRPAERNNLIVFNMNKKQFRTIKSTSIQAMTIEGTTFQVTN
jgi:hypothetical protein